MGFKRTWIVSGSSIPPEVEKGGKFRVQYPTETDFGDSYTQSGVVFRPKKTYKTGQLLKS
jgi:hypothetical protein